MLTREKPLACDPPPIIAQTAQGPVPLRPPRGVRAARVSEALGVHGIAFYQGVSSIETQAGLVGLVSTMGGDFVAALGALIGLAWEHPDQALEAEYTRTADLLEYGEAVWDELTAAGYSDREIYGMGVLLLGRVYESMSIDREAAVKLDFTAARPDSAS